MQNNKNGIWGNEARAEPAGYQKDTSLKKQRPHKHTSQNVREKQGMIQASLAVWLPCFIRMF